MLVLTRKVGESIVIDNKTTLRIENIRGDKVRISFDAPKEVLILRTELLEQERETKVCCQGCGDEQGHTIGTGDCECDSQRRKYTHREHMANFQGRGHTSKWTQ